MKTSHYISEAYGWFGAAYFLYDIWSMYEVFCAKPTGTHTAFGNNVINYFKENAMIIGHHIFIGGFGFLVITVRIYYCKKWFPFYNPTPFNISHIQSMFYFEK